MSSMSVTSISKLEALRHVFDLMFVMIPVLSVIVYSKEIHVLAAAAVAQTCRECPMLINSPVLM